MKRRSQSDAAARIVAAAAELLTEAGRAAVTTRGVAERAGVQAPAIYRLFGDKDGLLDAVAEYLMTEFTTAKAAADPTSDVLDPVENLRRGWDMTITFGLANPALFVLMSDPHRAHHSEAVKAGTAHLAARVHQVALAGRLKIGERQAVTLIHAAGTGAILATLAQPEAERDFSLAETMRDIVLERILIDADHVQNDAVTDPTVVSAIALQSNIDQIEQLSAGERALLAEWLGRITVTS